MWTHALLLLTAANQAFTQCRYEAVSLNSEVTTTADGSSILCSHVPEASGATGFYRTVCSFRVYDALNVTFDEYSLLSEYNELAIDNSTLEDSALHAQLIMNHYYCPLIDIAYPVLLSPNIIENLICTDINGTVHSVDQITVQIDLENTQPPEFDYFTYSYDITDTMIVGVDFTAVSKIYAEDKDNTLNRNPNDPSVKIIFEIQNGTDVNNMFQVVSERESITWPFKYRASITLTDISLLATNNFFTFNLLAKNEGNNALGTVTSAEIRINVFHAEGSS